ncbi:MAG: ribosomal RNA small subunit methyltransferase A [Deltaproteobacteria bacterium]|nr:ribosomal RNA small subunit methyltransferase A [Deltaproteobacteria bacterium]
MLPKGLKPKLGFDQNFMIDEDILDRIVSMSNLTKKDTVLEIGAGTGSLTKRLAKKAGKVIAIEIDESLKSHLKKNLAGVKNVKLVFGNALTELKHHRFNKVVSNIPYAISEPLIQKLIGKDFDLAVLTVPKVFASRLIADEKERRFTKLSFTFQTFFMITDSLDIQREVFHPQPKVNSIVIKFEKKNEDSLTCGLLLRDKMKVKNAIRESLCKEKKMTKNEARKALNTLKISSIEDKNVSELSVSQLRKLIEKVAGFRKINK